MYLLGGEKMKKVIYIYRVVYPGEETGDYEIMMEDGSVENFGFIGAMIIIKEKIKAKRNKLHRKEKIYLSFKPPHDLEITPDAIFECKPIDEKDIQFILEVL